ncbi:MAG: hypothetical protein RIB45_16405 [Marivibrio sp.]|uniref:hypothetical protein n=1 Tax=Marivibrio sp. TaxID=2039719 RepID=UPI0032EB684F
MADQNEGAKPAPGSAVRAEPLAQGEDELWDDEHEAVELREKAEALSNSKQLDVHTWSDHPEANEFVDAIYKSVFEGRKAEIRKKHLKVVLLDLYVTWCEDPKRFVSFSRNRNNYAAGSRYNELSISNLTIDVVDALVEAGLVEQVKGFKDRHTNTGRVSRIRPTDKLIAEFREARFGPLDIHSHEDRLTVILRGGDGNDGPVENIEYVPDVETERMSAMLAAYNDLLCRTFVDIPILEMPWIEAESEYGKTYRLAVSQRDKFVRRIFNRGSFGCGGRFYGGWWQRCPGDWRGHIFLDDEPTNEIDFSGLHIVMSYAERGIPYWEEVGDDPYTIPALDFLDDEEQSRAVAKSLLLVLLNAKNTKAAYTAFRHNAGSGTKEKRFTDEQLGQIHVALGDKHPRIADQFGADAGIRLMNRDSAITEHILQAFTDHGVPSLTLHDSYIVPCGHEDFLIEQMYAGFENVMGIALPAKPGDALKEKLERAEDLYGQLMSWMPYQDVPGQRDNEEAYMARVRPIRTDRYQTSWVQFEAWREPGRG